MNGLGAAKPGERLETVAKFPAVAGRENVRKLLPHSPLGRARPHAGISQYSLSLFVEEVNYAIGEEDAGSPDSHGRRHQAEHKGH